MIVRMTAPFQELQSLLPMRYGGTLCSRYRHTTCSPDLFYCSGQGGSDSQGRTSVGIVYNALPEASVMGIQSLRTWSHCLDSILMALCHAWAPV